MVPEDQGVTIRRELRDPGNQEALESLRITEVQLAGIKGRDDLLSAHMNQRGAVEVAERTDLLV